MKAEHINPFIRALVKSFDTMVGCKVRRGEIHLKGAEGTPYEVSGIIGLSGKAVGTVVLALSREVALKAASAMLMFEAEELDDDVIDAVGELANMVAGAAKAELAEFDMSVSLPNVITGRGHVVRFPSNVTPICIPFECQWGPLAVEVGLAPAPDATPAQAAAASS